MTRVNKRPVQTSTLRSFEDHLQAQLLRQGVRLPLNVVIGQQKFNHALEAAVRGTVADTVGGYMAEQIGAGYHNLTHKSILDMITHKVLHGLNGAVTGALLTGEKGILSGMGGAMVAESVTEMMAPNLDTLNARLDAGEDPKVIQREIERIADVARMAAATVALAAGQDVPTSIHTATNAVENNFLHLALPAVVVASAKVLWEAYNLCFPEEIEDVKDNVCQYIADETGLPVDQVRLIGESVLMGTSMTRAVKTGGNALMRGLCKKSIQEIVRDQAKSSTTHQVTGLKALDHSNKGLYHPHDVRQTLEDRYPGQVSSSTTPSPNAKNVKLAGQRHPETSIVFDQRGFPIFDDVAKFDTKISREISNNVNSLAHKKAATNNIKNLINTGKLDASQFTFNQLAAIQKGKAEIPDYIWHHHQEIGRMQLIPESLHKKTGHVGGMNMWFNK